MQFIKETIIYAAPEKVFDFHLLPDAFERLSPPWETVEIIQKADITKVGSQAIIETKLFGFIPARWVAEHTVYEYPRIFEDMQLSGPFRSWKHQHMVSIHEKGAILRDKIEFEPPLGFLGVPFVPFLVTPKLEKMFEYRHKVTKEWCEKN